ncbi:MAG TPA: hypothetical protein VG734_19425 [Lacunisphaera sp.]|nr:hypothetical protein [Lacunisphaera sp.]
MTVNQLHKITAGLIAKNKGDIDVAVDTTTCNDNPDAPIDMIEGAKYRRVQGVDDSGPVGPKCPFLVLTGGFQG